MKDAVTKFLNKKGLEGRFDFGSQLKGREIIVGNSWMQ